MLNSIALSSDQDFIFLIDDGDAVAYSLEDGDGVVIGLLGDQLTAATAHSGSATQLPFAMNTATTQWQLMFIPDSKTLYIFGVPKSGLEEEDPRSIGSTDIDPGRSIGSTDIDPGRSIGSTDIDPGRTIGSTDIDPGLTGDDEFDSEVSFDLGSMVIILQKEGDEIIISTQPK
jgi:hypothetical protein